IGGFQIRSYGRADRGLCGHDAEGSKQGAVKVREPVFGPWIWSCKKLSHLPVGKQEQRHGKPVLQYRGSQRTEAATDESCKHNGCDRDGREYGCVHLSLATEGTNPCDSGEKDDECFLDPSCRFFDFNRHSPLSFRLFTSHSSRTSLRRDVGRQAV